VNLGSFELVIFDSSLTKTDKISDKINEEQVAKYPSQLAQIHAKNAWLVVHHPFWGIKTDPEGGPSVQLVTPFDSAWKKARPQGISLIVSGHVHMFQLLSFDRDRPPQLVAGDSGADLAAPFPASVTGMKMSGASVVASESEREFGYTLLSKSGAGWDLTLRNRWGKPVASCSVQGNRTAC
jgi:hypothetical protein